MHFTLCLADGTVVESSRGDAPFFFVVGEGRLDAGLERVLYGLRAGERRDISIAPGTAFGRPDPEAIQLMPRSEFPAEMTLEEGSIIQFGTPSGDEVPGAVLEITESTVLVDFNHPLAGRQLSFEVEIVSVEGENG